jgi:hypothetical protein
MTSKGNEFLTKGFDSLSGGTTSKWAKGMSAVLFLVLTTLFSCSKESDNVTAGGGTTTTGTSISIDSTTTSVSTPEGSTATATNADDLLANSTFSSTVTIGFGTTNTITNPLSAKGVTITEANGDVTINATASEVEYILSGTTTNGSVKSTATRNSNLR